MWTKDFTDNCSRCLNVLFTELKYCEVLEINSRHPTKLRKPCSPTKRLSDSTLFSFQSFSNMFIWSLILVILVSPSVLSQGEEEFATISPDDSPPDTAELLSDDNPCKANPCGNGVCLQENKE